MTKNDVFKKRYLNFALYTVIFSLSPLYALATVIDKHCLSQASSDLERIYCEVLSRGEGGGLPRFEDFKQNDVLVQSLLLKRPAAKLKIKLPKQTKSKRNTHRKPISIAKIKPTIKPKVALVESSDAVSLTTSTKIDLARCRFTPSKIICGTNLFIMKTNEPNINLSPGVLDKNNKLDLPVYMGNKEDDLALQYYLLDAYTAYLSKMLDIGMGASTMSYTRFFHTYHDLQSKNVSFTERFETMYGFLKKDKKTMSISAVLSDKRPSDINQCDDINEQIIACDSGGFNWIYVN